MAEASGSAQSPTTDDDNTKDTWAEAISSDCMYNAFTTLLVKA